MFSKEKFVANNTTDLKELKEELKHIYAGIVSLSYALDTSEEELVDTLVGKFLNEEEAGIIKQQFIRNQ